MRACAASLLLASSLTFRGIPAASAFIAPGSHSLRRSRVGSPLLLQNEFACGQRSVPDSRPRRGADGSLAAGREDCKSCREQEILEEERVGAASERRAAFEEANRREKTRNIKIALGSFLSAVGLFFFQHSVIAPAQANPVLLLRAMEGSSTPLASALTNGRPTVVDFYADWCENCKSMAPSMREIEEQFKNQINFVVVDGAAEKNYDLVDAFRVDGIPHLAMVNSKGEVETAIIGAVPKEVVVDDIKALLAGRPLPYTGFDMFEGEDHNIKGQIEIEG